MVREMATKILGGAVGVLGLATDVAEHVVWYLAHQIDGRPRTRS
jgi:hypothetical protein